MKRGFIIITVIVIAIASAGYFYRLRKNFSSAPAAATGRTKLPSIDLIGSREERGGTGSVESSKFGTVAEEKVLDYFVGADNSVTIVKDDGTIVQRREGKTAIISTTTINGISQAAFSYDGKWAILGSGRENVRAYVAFNTIDKKWVPLPGISAPAWSPDREKLAFFQSSQSGQQLSTLDFSGKKQQIVPEASLQIRDAALVWIRPDVIAIIERSGAYVDSSAWLYDLKSKNLKTAASGPGLDILFNRHSPGNLVFQTTDSGRGGGLSFVSDSGALISKVNFLTLPKKCAFEVSVTASSSQNSTSGAAVTNRLFCAVPSENEFQNIILPDEYDMRAHYTVDTWYDINAATGDIKLINTASGNPVDAEKVKIRNGRVFFVNRYDQKLYALALD